MAPNVLGFKVFPRVLLAMLLVASIPMLGLWYLSIYKAQQEWQRTVDLNLSRAAQALEDRLDTWVTMHYYLLKENAALADIISMDPARQKPILQAMKNTYHWTYLAFTITPDGRNVSRSDDNPPVYYGDRRYVQQVVQGKPMSHEVVISRTTGKPAFALSVPIHDSRQNLVGVMALSSALDEVSKATAAVPIGNTGFAIVLDDASKVIAHGKPERVQETLQDFSTHPLLQQGIKDTSIVFDENGKRMIGYLKNTPQGWSILVQQDYNDAFSALREAKWQALLLLASTLLLVTLAALLLAHRLVHPIQTLTAVAEDISQGKVDLGTAIEEARRKDEIGALARAIERLSISLRMTFDNRPSQ